MRDTSAPLDARQTLGVLPQVNGRAAAYSVVGPAWDEQPAREAVVLIEPGFPADLELVLGVWGRHQEAVWGPRLAVSERAVNGRDWPGPGTGKGPRIRAGAVESSVEDGDLAAGHLQRVAVEVVSVRIA